MTKYIALFRGINVSGQKKIRMAELREHLTELNFMDIQTYIQSGNLIFDYRKTKQATLEKNISGKILEKYGFDVTTIVITPEELISANNKNPFSNKSGVNPKNIGISFLSEIPKQESIELLNEIDYSPEEFVISGKIIYLHYPNGFGRAKLTHNIIERKLKVRATTRNLRTVGKLIDLSDNLSSG